MTPLILRPTDNAPLPFPMPEPQRGMALRILITEARAAHVPPAMLVTHLGYGENLKYKATREQVMIRIMDEVPGMTVRMLARAFRRDKHWVRVAVRKEENAKHTHR
jgi:hypothetical protein